MIPQTPCHPSQSSSNGASNNNQDTRHYSEIMDVDEGFAGDAPFMSDFSFGPRRSWTNSSLDSAIEDIAPNVDVVSTYDLAILASEFQRTNIRTPHRSHPHPPPLHRTSLPVPSTRPPSCRQTSSPSFHAYRRQHSSQHASMDYRRSQRQSLVRMQSIQSCLGRMDGANAISTSHPSEISPNHIDPLELPPPRSSLDCHSLSTEQPQVVLDEDENSKLLEELQATLTWRRSKELVPKANYVQKNVRIRKVRNHRRPLRAKIPP